jgi:hypothetical protein
MVNKPYIEEKIEESVVIRTFSADIDEMELKWHWDEEDREIEPIGENDWQFQFDNELPIEINTIIKIPMGQIHRVIKGTTDLKMRIKKNYSL